MDETGHVFVTGPQARAFHPSDILHSDIRNDLDSCALRVMFWSSLCLFIILLYVVQDDIRHFRIRNEAILALVALFTLRCLWGGEVDKLASHGIFALAMLLLMMGLHRFRLLGGGDAKLLVAAELWLGLEHSAVFATLLLVAALAYAAGAAIGILPSRKVLGRTLIPFGPPIAFAWAATFALLGNL